jgi:AcrR family transcriptional regulator
MNEGEQGGATLNRFERRKQRTREALKQAAMELILDKGYDAVSVQDITDRADLGRGTFYVHFNDKEDLIWNVVREGFDAVTRMIAGFADESPKLEYRIWICMFEHAEAHRDLYLVTLSSKGSMQFTERTIDYLAQVVIAEMHTKRFYPNIAVAPEITAQVIVGGLIRLIIWWLLTPNAYSARDMAGQFYRLIFGSEPPEMA